MNSFRTETEVEIDGEAVYDWVLENCKDELIDQLSDEICGKTTDDIVMKLAIDENELVCFLNQIIDSCKDADEEGTTTTVKGLSAAIDYIEKSQEQSRITKLENEVRNLQQALAEAHMRAEGLKATAIHNEKVAQDETKVVKEILGEVLRTEKTEREEKVGG